MAHSSSLNSCPECYSHDIFEDNIRGENICSNCGLVIDERKVVNLPKRVFDPEKLNHKQNGPMNDVALPMRNLTTSFRVNEAGFDKNKVRRMYKMQKLSAHERTERTMIRNVERANKIMNDLKNKLSLSSAVVIDSLNMYKDLMKKRFTRGRNKHVLIVTCFFMRCRISKRRITMEDFASSSGIPIEKIRKCYRAIQKTDPTIKIPHRHPSQYIIEICNNLKGSQYIETVATRLADMLESRTSVDGKNPKGIAASLVLLACRITSSNYTQRNIQKASNITTVTIRKRINEIENIIDIEAEIHKMKDGLNKYLRFPLLQQPKRIKKKRFNKNGISWNTPQVHEIFLASRKFYVHLLYRKKCNDDGIVISKELIKHFKDKFQDIGVSSRMVTLGAIYGLMKNDPMRIGYAKEGIPTLSRWKDKSIEEFVSYFGKMGLI